jgi:glucokinase
VTRDRDFVLAIDFGGTKIALATAGLDGRPLERRVLATEAQQGAPLAMRRALDEAAGLVARRGGRCLGAGVVCPGVIRPDRVDLVPSLPGWERLALHDVLREGLGLECVAVANDVKAAAEAEARWGSLRGADPADGRAPLEEFASGAGLGRRGGVLVGRPVSAAEVFALAETEPAVHTLVEETLAELAVHVANWCVLLDPARVAVGGGLMRSADRVLDALARRLRSAVPFPPELVAARFVEDGALHGAIALALDALHSDSLARLRGRVGEGDAR